MVLIITIKKYNYPLSTRNSSLKKHWTTSDGEPPILEFVECGVPLFPGSLRPGVVVPVKFLSVGQIDLFNHLLWIIIISYLKCMQIVCIRSEYLINRITNVNSNTWNCLTVCKQMTYHSFKNKLTYKLFSYKLYKNRAWH